MDFFIGTLLLFPYTFIPEGFLPCDGRQLSINDYQALYALIGIRYGGNGSSTFNLPNLTAAKPNDSIQYFIAVTGIYPEQP